MITINPNNILIALFIIGVFFPIYGPSLLIKVSIFRLGLGLSLIFSLFFSTINTSLRLPLPIFIGFLLVFYKILNYLALNNGGNLGNTFWMLEGLIALTILTKYLMADKKSVKFFIKTLFYTGCLSNFIILIQATLYYFSDYEFSLPYTIGPLGISSYILENYGYPIIAGRVSGGFMDSQMTGTSSAYFISFFAPLYFYRNSIEIKFRKGFLLISLLSAFLAVISSGSRQSLLISVLVLFLLYISSASKFYNIFVRIFLVITGLILSYFLLSELGLDFNLVKSSSVGRLLDTTGANGGLTGGRLFFILETLRRTPIDAYMYGLGESQSFLIGSDIFSHNGFLVTLVELGIPGFTLLVLIFYLSLNRIIRLPKGAFKNQSFCILFTFFYFVFVNWAQLNQNLSYIFIALIFIKPTLFPDMTSLKIHSPKS